MKLSDDVKQLLKPKEQPASILALRDRCLKLVRMSRNDMAKSYAAWDEAYNTYKATKYNDEEDQHAEERDEPTKMVMPLAFTQVEAFISFAYLLFTQNKYFFQLGFRGAEDALIRQFSEEILQRDLDHNKFNVLLIKWLRCIGIYNLGIFKNVWTTTTSNIPSKTDNIYDYGKEASYTEVTTYQGNEITTLSPYSFFPDTRYPMSEFQKGEFCADEKEMSRASLEELEANGHVIGIKHLRELSKETLQARGDLANTRLPSISDHFTRSNNTSLPKDSIIDVQIDLIPKSFKQGESFPLGKYDKPVRYFVTIANDDRVIAITPHGYLHNQFTYSLAEMSPDIMQTVGDSMPTSLEKVQDIMTWLVNSRVTSVSRSLQHNVICDPSVVDVESLRSRSPVVFVKKNTPRGGINDYFKPLPPVDTTANHTQDMQTFNSIAQLVWGINDNAMGQYNSGRRSASEARVVTQGAASRLTTLNSSIYSDGIIPLGSQMLSNLRDGVDENEFDAVYGLGMNEIDEVEKQKVFIAFKSNPTHLARMTDLIVFDGTLPSEKVFLAQSLQEILVALLANPEAAQLFNLSPQKIFEQIQELRGVRKLSRFSLTPNPTTDAGQIIDTTGAITTPNGIPSTNQVPLLSNGVGANGRT